MISLRSLISLGAFASSAFALNNIKVDGQDFVDASTGNRFTIVGIDYQPGGESAAGTGHGDPLSNGTLCLRDAALMQSLGINTIRSYNVDPTLNHDECASIFNAVGIYMILDVNSPQVGQSIDRSAPWTSYYDKYLEHIFSVVEAFKSYPNTLAFFAGNELINDLTTGKYNPQYIRAVQRDLKDYISKHSSRHIPVGYSAAQVQDFLADTWAYLQCDNGDNSAGELFGLNSYSWCGSGPDKYQTAGYANLQSLFSASSIPVFFSEYGCNVPAPRVFDEVPTLYSDKMSALSGGLVYEYTQGPDNYGLIQENDDGSISLLADFDTFRTQLGKVDFNYLANLKPNATAEAITPPKCNANLISADGFSTNFTIPVLPPNGAGLIQNGISNPPTGKIVSVTQTNVQIPVKATNGALITGLKITMNGAANTPNGQALATGSAGTTSSGAKPTGTTTGSTSSQPGAAMRTPAPVVLGGVMAAAVLGAGALVL